MGRRKVNQDKIIINTDTLCELVNNKYKLKPNEIGSIEHYSDMCESSIVQICNKARGHRQLISGPELVLKTYLRNILEDKTILNF